MYYIPLIIVVVLIVLGINKNNAIVVKKNRIDNAWGQIDVQLKRRFDLIPNLVETVKGSADFEKSTLVKISEARNMYTAATNISEKINANNMMTRAMGGFVTLSEQYPSLQTNANFKRLMDELTDIENKIAYSRQFYNDTVLLYNNEIEIFPGSIIANMKKLQPATYFQVDEQSKENVKVSF